MIDSKEIFELFQEIGSYSAVAKRLGIDPRTVKKHVKDWHENNSFASKEATRTGIPFSRIRHYWLKTKNELGDDVSIFVKNEADAMEYDEIRNQLIEDLSAFAPEVALFKRDPLPVDKKHLLVLDPADIHIGKLAMEDETGDDYNIDIALRRVYKGVEDILYKSENFGIENIVLIVGNDVLHIDNQRRGTTSGTPQDTDSQWWDMFEVARQMYVRIIESCKQIAPVTLVYCPSNHDKLLGFSLVDSLYSWYRNDENVTVSNYGKSMRHRKYIQYGNNLIGVTHGDGAKLKDLTTLMQYEARDEWATTKFAYWYTHHLHHKIRQVNGLELEKDHPGVTIIGSTTQINPTKNTSVEVIRSPSSADAWHAQNGYINTTAIEAFIHHPTDGQIARLTSYV